jgi:hypothetical protein
MYYIIVEQVSFKLNRFIYSPVIVYENGGVDIWDLLGGAAELVGALV